jgi:hypothetical protein
MTLLPRPRSTLELETTFGRVRMYEFGAASADRTAISIILLPGRTSGVPMWASNLPDLVAARRTYALDALGDAGLSVQSRPISDAADQADWLDQVLAHLPVRSVLSSEDYPFPCLPLSLAAASCTMVATLQT